MDKAITSMMLTRLHIFFINPAGACPNNTTDILNVGICRVTRAKCETHAQLTHSYEPIRLFRADPGPPLQATGRSTSSDRLIDISTKGTLRG